MGLLIFNFKNALFVLHKGFPHRVQYFHKQLSLKGPARVNQSIAFILAEAGEQLGSCFV